MADAAFRVFERHGAADILLHFRLVTRDATRRARLLDHRLAELVEEVGATGGGFAGLVANHAALCALAETLVLTVIVISHVSFVVERSWRLGLLARFLRRFCRIELGIDNLAVKPENSQFRSRAFILLVQVVTAD